MFSLPHVSQILVITPGYYYYTTQRQNLSHKNCRGVGLFFLPLPKNCAMFFFGKIWICFKSLTCLSFLKLVCCKKNKDNYLSKCRDREVGVE